MAIKSPTENWYFRLARKVYYVGEYRGLRSLFIVLPALVLGNLIGRLMTSGLSMSAAVVFVVLGGVSLGILVTYFVGGYRWKRSR
ncbi:MAG: hypothetical protein WBP22_00865 [Candidatus Saccharimonas sp.]